MLATRVDGADAGALRSAVDQLKSRLGSAIIVLGSVESDSKVVLVAGVTADQTGRVKAGELIGAVAAQVGGKGGGRADFAQAGGSKPQALDEALASVDAVGARAPGVTLMKFNVLFAAINGRDCSQWKQSYQRDSSLPPAPSAASRSCCARTRACVNACNTEDS